jgi:hypothetical protein
MEYSLQLRADKYLILADIAPRYSMAWSSGKVTRAVAAARSVGREIIGSWRAIHDRAPVTNVNDEWGAQRCKAAFDRGCVKTQTRSPVGWIALDSNAIIHFKSERAWPK